MRLVVNIDAATSDVFNDVRGSVSVGAFAAICVRAHLEFLKGKMNDKEDKSIRVDEVHT